MAHERGGVKEIILTDGCAQKKEVEELIDAVGRLSSPGAILHGAAHAAIETYRLLEHADQCRAADALAGHLEVMLGRLDGEMKALVREARSRPRVRRTARSGDRRRMRH